MCRFLSQEVREKSRFFVAPPRAFPLSVWHGLTDFLIHKYLHLSIPRPRYSGLYITSLFISFVKIVKVLLHQTARRARRDIWR